MWSLGPYSLDLLREFRLFFTSSHSDCWCGPSALIAAAFVSGCCAFWCGAAITACVLSSRCRRLAFDLAQVFLRYFVVPAPVRDLTGTGFEVAARERLRGYRA